MKKLIILGVLLLLSPTITVKAEYKIHDGRPFGNPIMDSGAPRRYSSPAKYYDIAIPYDTPFTELGGYAEGMSFSMWNYKKNGVWKTIPSAYATFYRGMYAKDDPNKTKINDSTPYKVRTNVIASTDKKKSVGKITEPDYLYEPPDLKQYGMGGYYNETLGSLAKSGYTINGNDNGWCYTIDKSGNKYLAAAIGNGLYANKALGWTNQSNIESGALKPGAGSIGESGLVYDIILKDGTQIHCVAQDFQGTGHSWGNSPSGQDGVWMFGGDKIKYGQYKGFWYMTPPFHAFECVAIKSFDFSKFITESNPACYIRIWDTSLYQLDTGSSGITVNSSMAGTVTSASQLNVTPSSNVLSGDGVAVDSGSNSGSFSSDSNTTTPATPNGQFMGGIMSEDSLATVNKLTEVDIHGLFLEDAKEENLEQEELEGLVTWKRNIKSNTRENGIYKWARIIMVWAGLLFILWGTLLYIAYWVDRVNGIYFFNFVGILTLGKLQISDTEEECTYSSSGKSKTKTINHRVVIFISLLSIFFGGMIITGYIYTILSYIIHKIISILS